MRHPATKTHASYPRTEREARGITDATTRLSIGIENVHDLVTDLGVALRATAA